MNTCNTCKHWGTVPYEYQDDEAQEYTVVEAPQRICGRVTLLETPADSQQRQAFTLDASRYKCDLWTAPGFSCALFEANP